MGVLLITAILLKANSRFNCWSNHHNHPTFQSLLKQLKREFFEKTGKQKCTGNKNIKSLMNSLCFVLITRSHLVMKPSVSFRQIKLQLSIHLSVLNTSSDSRRPFGSKIDTGSRAPIFFFHSGRLIVGNHRKTKDYDDEPMMPQGRDPIT